MSAYDKTEEDNIYRLALGINCILYQRLCRLIGIPREKIGYSLRDKEQVLSEIKQAFLK